MIVIIYNDMDVITPYATNEPLSHCYATNGWCFFTRSHFTKLCEKQYS